MPFYECEDNGVSAAMIRPGSERDTLVCITTWTQSGMPILVQAETMSKTEIKSDQQRGQGKLGSRIQCAAFSSSGEALALVNENGDFYLVSNLDVSPMIVQRVATTKKFIAKSDAIAMAFMALPDGEAIVAAWASSSKSMGYIKKIPMRLMVRPPD